MLRRINVLMAFAAVTVYAQTPESFFPHHNGDVWQYRSAFTGEIVFTERFVRDSVDQTGNVFIWYNRSGSVMPGTGLYRIDTLYNVYQLYTVNDTTNQPLLYRLSADSGVGWTYLRSPWDSILARVVRVFPASVFGQQVTMKKIEYIRYPPAGGFWIGNRYLATGFGFVRWEIEPSDTYVLTGAIIDSVQYGTIVEVIEKRVLPTDFQLHQNYPNPFNPVTTIRYEVPRKAYVQLDVFTVLGEQVATLVDQVQDAGIHQLQFNALHLPSGVYFYRLKADAVLLTRKMLLVR